MSTPVILSIQGRQSYAGQEPEVIRLDTEGYMEFRDGGWDIVYEESELTGLAGAGQGHPDAHRQAFQHHGIPGGRGPRFSV